MYPYSDLDPTQWYHDGVHFCLEEGLMIGTDEGEFSPEEDTTRATIVTILWRLEGCPVSEAEVTFRDVEDGAWYFEAVRWANEMGIVEGYSSRTFGPNDVITREQLVLILCRYAQFKGMDVTGDASRLTSFPDASQISSWAANAMEWACGTGLIQGISVGDSITLAPGGNTSRAELATILQRFITNIAAE